MTQSIHPETGSWPERLRVRFGRRAMGILLALAFELLLLLALLTLAPSLVRHQEQGDAIFSINPSPDPSVSPQEAQEPAKKSAIPAPSEQRPQDQTPAPPQTAVAPPPPAYIRVTRDQMAASDIGALPKTAPSKPPKGSTYGPTDKGSPGDTPRVEGSGPNGEPLYRAAWYREPYPDELSGYLSTAQGPGWALIACRTVADFRVEDCIKLSEYPDRSGIARSVLAAAWQFRVRPPRLGGVSKVGEWVRIRIDYGIKQGSP